MVAFYVFAFFPLVIVVASTLRAMKWGSFALSLFDALLIKFASTLGLMLGLGPHIYSVGPVGLLLYGTYATLVEGVVLTMLQRHPLQKTWSAVVVANLFAMLFLALLYLFKVISFNEPPAPAIS